MAPVRGTLMKWPMKDARLWETRLWDGLCEKHAYERRTYEMAVYEMAVYERRAYKRYVYERHAYGRRTPMRWPSMGCIPCKMHAYEAAPVRGTHMRDVSMR
jgi:hypothetical protein